MMNLQKLQIVFHYQTPSKFDLIKAQNIDSEFFGGNNK